MIKGGNMKFLTFIFSYWELQSLMFVAFTVFELLTIFQAETKPSQKNAGLMGLNINFNIGYG